MLQALINLFKKEELADPRFEGVKPSNIVRLENGERELMKNCVFVPKAVNGGIQMVWVRL